MLTTVTFYFEIKQEPTDGGRWFLESSSAVCGSVLRWWDRFVRLARGSVNGLDPQHPVLLVIAGEHHQVALPHRVEEHPATLQP